MEAHFEFPTIMSNDPEILQGEIDRLRLQVESLQAKSGAKSISIGNYLLTRLAQLGATVRSRRYAPIYFFNLTF